MFVHLACIALVLQQAVARPDLSLGYRYNQGHSSSGAEFLGAPHEQPREAIVQTSYAPTASSSNYFSSAPALGQLGNGGFVPSSPDFGFGNAQQSFGGSVGAANLQSSGGLNTQFTSSSSSSNQNYQSNSNYQSQQEYLSHLQLHQTPIINKHFYIHSAPEDHDEQQIVRYVNVGRPQKNYRVVFINAPSSSVSKAKIIANVAPVEEKTAIYVLSKKSNSLDVTAEAVTQAPVNHKPEVFFIKYKTPQEAVHAQHTIQAQYDQLGGSSDVSNEGILPVSSVIGSLDGDASAAHSSAGSNLGSYESESAQSQNFGTGILSTGNNQIAQTYLPPHRK